MTIMFICYIHFSQVIRSVYMPHEFAIFMLKLKADLIASIYQVWGRQDHHIKKFRAEGGAQE